MSDPTNPGIPPIPRSTSAGDAITATLAGMRPPPTVLDVHTTEPAPALLPRAPAPLRLPVPRVVPSVTVGDVVRNALSLGEPAAPTSSTSAPTQGATPDSAPEVRDALPETAPVTAEALAETGPAPRKRPSTGTYDPTSGYRRGPWGADESVALALAVLRGTTREDLFLDFPTRSPEALSHRLKRWTRVAANLASITANAGTAFALFWARAKDAFHTASKAVRESRNDGLLMPPVLIPYALAGYDFLTLSAGAHDGAALPLRTVLLRAVQGAPEDAAEDTASNAAPDTATPVYDPQPVTFVDTAVPPRHGVSAGAVPARETVRMAVSLDGVESAPEAASLGVASSDTAPPDANASGANASARPRAQDVAAWVNDVLARVNALSEKIAQGAPPPEPPPATPERLPPAFDAALRTLEASMHARTELMSVCGEMLTRLSGTLAEEPPRHGVIDDARTIRHALESGLPIDELALLRALAVRVEALSDVVTDFHVAFLTARHADTRLTRAVEVLRPLTGSAPAADTNAAPTS
jgi:hypothetical protein